MNYIIARFRALGAAMLSLIAAAFFSGQPLEVFAADPDANWEYDVDTKRLSDGTWTFEATLSGAEITVGLIATNVGSSAITGYPTEISPLNFSKKVTKKGDSSVEYAIKKIGALSYVWTKAGDVFRDGTQYIGEFTLPGEGFADMYDGPRSPNTSNLYGDIVIPSTVTNIGRYFFRETKITSLTAKIKAKNVIIGSELCSKCYDLTKVVLAGEGSYVDNGGKPFQKCSAIGDADFSSLVSVSADKNRVFLSDCASLTNVVLSSDLTLIRTGDSSVYLDTYCGVLFGNNPKLATIRFTGAPPEDLDTWIENDGGYLSIFDKSQSIATIVPTEYMEVTNGHGKCWKDYAANGELNTTDSTWAQSKVKSDVTDLSMRKLLIDRVPEGFVEIHTAEDFLRLKRFPTYNYRLMADIDLTGSDFETIAEFSGTLDGNGFTVSGVGAQPLIGVLTGTVIDLTLDGFVGETRTTLNADGTAAGYGAAALCVSNCNGRIERSVVSGYEISGNSSANLVHYLGTFAAQHLGGVIADCVSSNNVLSGDTGAIVGGIVGGMGGSSSCVAVLTNCVNLSAVGVKDVCADISLGGISGTFCGASGSAASATIMVDCINRGTVSTGTGSGEAGGLVGAVPSGVGGFTLLRCANFGAVTSTSGDAAGLVNYIGALGGGSGCLVQDCSNYGAVTAAGTAVGLVAGMQWTPGGTCVMQVVNCGNYGALTGATRYELVASVDSTAGVCDCSEYVKFDNCFVEGTPLHADPMPNKYTVTNVLSAADSGYVPAKAFTNLNEIATANSWCKWYLGRDDLGNRRPELVAFSVNEFTVCFLDWNDTELSRQQVKEGADAVPPPDPHRSGYTFIGWTDNWKSVLQDEIVRAQYKQGETIYYQVRFLDWDDTVLTNEQVLAGAAAVPPPEPVRAGYDFVGWDKPYDNIAAATDIRAQYQVQTTPTVYVSTEGVDAEGRGAKNKPFKTPAFAVSQLGSEGGIVYVAAGTYGLTSPITISTPVRLVGEPYADGEVVFKMTKTPHYEGGQETRVLILKNAEAFVTGVTLTKGTSYYFHSGANLYIGTAGGTASNCVMSAGFCTFNSDGAGFWAEGGLITHCKIIGNTSDRSSAYGLTDAAVIFYAKNVRVENCLFANNETTGQSHIGKLAGSAVLRNCTFVENVSPVENDTTYGGRYLIHVTSSSALVQNCVFIGNHLKGLDTPTPFKGSVANFWNSVYDGHAEFAEGHDCVTGAERTAFMDYDGGDYVPSKTGPLMNHGLEIPGFSNLTDLAGKKRVVKIIDIGAYESQYMPGLIITGKRID